MPDTKLLDLAGLTDSQLSRFDQLEVVDVSDTSMDATGTNKRVLVDSLLYDRGANVFNVKAYGAVGDGSADDTAAIQNAINDAKANGFGGTVFFPPGRYMVNTLTIQPADTFHRVRLIGSGTAHTDLFARTGTSDALIKFVSPDGSSSVNCYEVAHMQIYMAAFAFPCISIDRVGASHFHDLLLVNGAYGIYCTIVGGSRFDHIIINNPSTCAFYINGENSGENFYCDISITKSDGGTLVNGFRVERTTNTDFGGHYMLGVRIVEVAGSTISGNGFLFDSSAAYTFLGVSMVDCVADSITGPGAKFLNATDCRLVNTWFNANPAYPVVLDGCRKIQITGCDLSSPTGGVQFLGSTTNVNTLITITGCVIPAGTAFNMPASNFPVACWYSGNQIYGATAISNDLAAYALSRTQGGAGDFGTESLYSLTAMTPLTAAATASANGTGIGSMTVPANHFAVGKTYRLKASGIWTTAATAGTRTIFVKIGGVTIATTGALTPTVSMTNRPWTLDVVFTVRATGSGTSANVMANGMFSYAAVTPSTATTSLITWQMTNTAVSAGFDSTVANLVDLQFTASVGTGSFTVQNMTLSKEM